MADTPQKSEDQGDEITGAAPTSRPAGAFDIRNFIGALIGFYGIVCLLLGIFSFDSSESVRTGGINANLIAGVCMVAFAAIFLIWAKVRPVVIPTVPAEEEASAGQS